MLCEEAAEALLAECTAAGARGAAAAVWGDVAAAAMRRGEPPPKHLEPRVRPGKPCWPSHRMSFKSRANDQHARR